MGGDSRPLASCGELSRRDEPLKQKRRPEEEQEDELPADGRAHGSKQVCQHDPSKKARDGPGDIFEVREKGVVQAPDDPEKENHCEEKALFFELSGVNKPREIKWRRQEKAGPETNRPAIAFAARDVAQANNVRSEAEGGPNSNSCNAIPTGAGRHEEKEKAARGHNHRGKRDGFMNRIVKQNAQEQRHRQAERCSVEEINQNHAKEQPRDSVSPHVARRNGAGRDGPFLAIESIEFHIKSVVQIHTPNVKARRAGADKQERFDGTPAAQQPPCETIGPDSRKIRDAAKHEKRAQILNCLGRQRRHGGVRKTGIEVGCNVGAYCMRPPSWAESPLHQSPGRRPLGRSPG